MYAPISGSAIVGSTYTNTVEMEATYGGSPLPKVSDDAQFKVVDPYPWYSLSKSASESKVKPNDEIEYTITLSNHELATGSYDAASSGAIQIVEAAPKDTSDKKNTL